MASRMQHAPARVLLALLACMMLTVTAMAASARPSGYGMRRDQHEQYGEQQTDSPRYRPAYGRDDHEDREEHEHENHYRFMEDRHDHPGPSHDEYHPGPSHDDYEEKKPKFKTICLQSTRPLTNAPSAGTSGLKEEFRCCKPEDEVARTACLSETGVEDPYPEGGKGPAQGGDMLDTLLTSSPAMTCTSDVTPDCPQFVSNSDQCLKFQTNCTLTLKAAGCGCPPDLVYFQAVTYGREIDVLSCTNNFDNIVDTDGPFKGKGFIRQGAINSIQTREGLREAKGSLKIIELIASNDTVKATEPLPELPLIQTGRLIIKLQEGSQYK